MSVANTLATRYRCLYQAGFRCGGDQPKRTRCTYCRGPMHTLRGLWGAFAWRGDGVYREVDAKRTFVRLGAADKWAGERDLVTRWISRD